MPKNLLHVHSYSCLRRYLLKNKSIISIIDIGAYFPEVRGEQIILTLRNQFQSGNLISINSLSENQFAHCCEVEQDFYSDEILLFGSEREYEIYRKLENNYAKFSDVCKGYVGRGRASSVDAIAGKDIRKFGFKSRKVPEKGGNVFIQNIYSAEAGIIAAFAGNELEAEETVTVFTDGDENMCRYMLGILHSRLCNFYLLKFCYNNSRLTMHTDAKYLKRIPLVGNDKVLFNQLVSLVRLIEKEEYMSDLWFEMLEDINEIVYKIYNISVDEKKYIDEEVKKLQSERWNKQQ